jgi:hypothetical protein
LNKLYNFVNQIRINNFYKKITTMKKITFIISALTFSVVSFAQTTEVEKKAIEREAQIVNGVATEVEPAAERVNNSDYIVPVRAVDQNSRMSTGTRMESATEIQGQKLNRDGNQIDASETVPVSNQLAPEIKIEESKLQDADTQPRLAQPKDATTAPRK